MAKKALLRDHDNIEILPITRGELVLDSSGKVALHSNEFLASNSRPGLMSAEDKAALNSLAGGTIDSDLSTTSTNPVQNKVVTNAINSIKTSYLKSATVSTNTLTIVDQNNKETKFYNTTYGVVTQAADGLAPKLGTDASATIGTQADEWVLTSTKGSAPTWRKLPVNAFKNDNNNTTYTFASGNGGFTVTPSGGTAQTVSIGKPATAGTADKLVCEAASTNSFRHVWFSYDGEDGRLVYDNDFTYNPATNVLNVGSITGSAGSVAWGNITGRPDSFTPSAHNHTTEQITSLSNYKKATSASDLATSDTLNSALGKLEYTARYAYDWVIGVTATDTDEYINKWSEIVGFLDSVKEGTDILDEFVTRKTAQSITGAKTFDLNVKTKSGIDLYGATDYTNLPDSNFKLGHNKGLIHFRATNSTNYWGNAITWAYSDSDNAQAGIYVTTGGSYGSEMWFATTNLFDDGPKAALHINNSGDIRAVRGKFRGTFVTTNGTSSQFVKGDGSLDNTTYATSASLGNYLPLTGGVIKNGATRNPLTIDTTNEMGAYINFAANGAIGAYIGYNSSVGAFMEESGTALKLKNGVATLGNYIILHSGNYNSYAPKLDGTGATGTWNINISGDASTLDGVDLKDLSRYIFKRNITYGLNDGDDLNNLTYDKNALGYYTTGDNKNYLNSPLQNFGLWVTSLNTVYTGQLMLPYGRSRLHYRSQVWSADGLIWTSWDPIAWVSDIPTKVSQLTNDSGFLTSHQSLANYVTLNTAQTITGLKTFESASNTVGVSLILKNKNWYGGMSTAIDFYTGGSKTAVSSRIEDYMNGDGSAGGCLRFFTQSKSDTNPNPNGLVERMRIDNYGYIRIYGTTVVSNNIELGSHGILGFGSTIPTKYIDSAAINPDSSAVWLASTGGGGEATGIMLDGNTIKMWSPINNPIKIIDSDAANLEYDLLHTGNIDSHNLITITKTLTVTKDWMDTGIKYTDLTTGTYAVQVYVHSSGDGIWYGTWSGVLSWYGSSTNGSRSDEILLHCAGHAVGPHIYLRTSESLNSAGTNLRLQIAASKNLTSATYTFKFKKLI